MPIKSSLALPIHVRRQSVGERSERVPAHPADGPGESHGLGRRMAAVGRSALDHRFRNAERPVGLCLPASGRTASGSIAPDACGHPKAPSKNSGLHYNWHRHYDPSLGRYTQPDPLGFVDGPSVYAYAKNGPVRYIDPDGRLVPAIVIAFCRQNPRACAAAGAATIGAIGSWLQGRSCPRDRFYSDSPSDGTDDTSSRPPAGSLPIDKTPWSGDHGKIKGAIEAGPTDDVRIDPSDNVWSQNPNGTWTNHGPASNYTGSGKPKGRRGRDRDRR